MEKLKASEIRELLKLTEHPEMISFAGGLPEPDLFPLEEIAAARQRVLENFAKEALQYSVTEGYYPLRKQIADRMNRLQGSEIIAEQVLITTGSQQGLDITAKLFLNEGDLVLSESPTYLGALNAFQSYQPRFVEVNTDEQGMDLDDLDHLLTTQKVKLIYVNPNFQNPTGRSWSVERRKLFMERVQQADVIVVEDDPYGELSFEDMDRPSLKSLDQKGCVIYLGSFSKIFCPGYRVAWLIASDPWMQKYVLLKQAMDLHSSTISQREISCYLEKYSVDKHIGKLRESYRRRRDVMLQLLKKYMPIEVRYTTPTGGLFIWLELPKNIDARELLQKCLSQQVAFVPGGAFFPNGGHENTLRLSYSVTKEEQIIEGVRRLAKVIRLVLK